MSSIEKINGCGVEPGPTVRNTSYGATKPCCLYIKYQPVNSIYLIFVIFLTAHVCSVQNGEKFLKKLITSIRMFCSQFYWNI